MSVQITILSGARQGERIGLDASEFRAGDKRDCEIYFDVDHYPLVRNRTVLFQLSENGWTIVNAGVGEILVNQQMIQESSRLRSGDLVRLSDGGPDLLFTIGARLDAAVTPAAKPSVEPLARETAGPAPPSAGQLPRWVTIVAAIVLVALLGIAIRVAKQSSEGDNTNTIQAPVRDQASGSASSTELKPKDTQPANPNPTHSVTPINPSERLLETALEAVRAGQYDVARVRLQECASQTGNRNHHQAQKLLDEIDAAMSDANAQKAVEGLTDDGLSQLVIFGQAGFAGFSLPELNSVRLAKMKRLAPGETKRRLAHAAPAEQSPPWSQDINALRDSLYLLVVEQPRTGSAWPLATCSAVGPNTLLTTATVATELAKLRAGGMKVLAVNGRLAVREEITDIRIHLAFVKSQEQREEQPYFDLALLNVNGRLLHTIKLTTSQELSALEPGLGLACIGYSHDGAPLNRFQKHEPKLQAVQIRLITGIEIGGPRLLHLHAALPANLYGSPIINSDGKLVALYCDAAPAAADSPAISMHYAPLVQAELVELWLNGGMDRDSIWTPPPILDRAESTPPSSAK